MNEILIAGLRVNTRIGVPDEERLVEQEVELDLRIETMRAFEAMEDHLEKTIDYARVCDRVAEIASLKPRQLIETLANEVAEMVLCEFHARSVEVELRKFILPQTRYVAVRCARTN